MQIDLTEDEALVLLEYFERFDESEDLSFVHAAEYLVFQRIAAQVCTASTAMFKLNYDKLLKEARERIASEFEGEIPCFKPDTNKNT